MLSASFVLINPHREKQTSVISAACVCDRRVELADQRNMYTRKRVEQITSMVQIAL